MSISLILFRRDLIAEDVACTAMDDKAGFEAPCAMVLLGILHCKHLACAKHNEWLRKACYSKCRSSVVVDVVAESELLVGERDGDSCVFNPATISDPTQRALRCMSPVETRPLYQSEHSHVGARVASGGME